MGAGQGAGGTGRQTARALVELFTPSLEAVKHVVADEAQRERTHRAFLSLAEQWERFTQRAQRLARREILVRLPEEERVRTLRTMTVPQSEVPDKELMALKRALARGSGCPREEMARAIAKRESQDGPKDAAFCEAVEDRAG